MTKRERPVAKSDTAQNYEEWIPQHHLKKDAGSVKKRKGGRAVSPSSGSNLPIYQMYERWVWKLG